MKKTSIVYPLCVSLTLYQKSRALQTTSVVVRVWYSVACKITVSSAALTEAKFVVQKSEKQSRMPNSTVLYLSLDVKYRFTVLTPTVAIWVGPTAV